MSDPVTGNDERECPLCGGTLGTTRLCPSCEQASVSGNVPDELVELVASKLIYPPTWHIAKAEAVTVLAAVLPVVRQQIAAQIETEAAKRYGGIATGMRVAARVVRGEP